MLVGVGLAALMAVTLGVGLSQHPSSFDDAYITYRYARNIAQGRGFVYNVGKPVLGTTTPLYALLLAGLSLVWPDVPTVSHVLGVVAWMLSVPVIYGIARHEGDEVAAVVPASLIAVNALFLDVLGMETTLYVLVTLTAFYLYLKEHYVWAGLFAGVAFLTRWDGILVGGTLMVAAVLKDRRRFPKSLLAGLGLIVPWLIYSQVTFGSIFPNTFFAKAGQGWNEGLGAPEIGSFARGIALTAAEGYRENALLLLPLGLSVVGAWSAIRNRVTWWPPILWTVAYAGGYVVLGVLRFPWYYPPLVPTFLLLVGQGVTEFVGSVPHKLRGPRVGLAAALVMLCLIPNVDWLLANRRSGIDRHVARYTEVGKWLRDHTPSRSSVATIEIGVIGYYSDRTIVDTMGLVSPAMVGHLDDWLQTLKFALNHYWPDYAVTLRGTAWDGVVHEPWFREAYAPVEEAQDLDPDDRVSIYRRRAGFPIDDFAVASSGDVWFENQFVLRAFRVAEEELGSGDRLHVRLVWQALADLTATYRLRFDLLSARSGERTALAEGAQPMRGGNPTRLWRAGDQVVDDHTLLIPAGVAPGPHLLRLSVTGEDGPPGMADATGIPVEYLVAGPIQIGRDDAVQNVPGRPVDATFADSVRLEGYELDERGRDRMEVTLYWEAAGPVSRDYTVFVHLVSPDGELVAQHDSPPALPTKLWVPGTQVVDSHPLSVPEHASLEGYEIRTGMYHWPDLKRLSVVESHGFDAARDALLLRRFGTDPQ